MSVQSVAVLGAGTMGHGIAHVSAVAGCSVTLYDVSPEAAKRGLASIERNMDKGVARGKLDAADRDAALGRIRAVADLQEAVTGADLVVEAVPEKLALKQELFRTVEPWVGRDTILGTNTSSLSVGAIASATEHPDRVIGLHFFNPVHIMKLLEIIVAEHTTEAVLERCRAYGEAIGKQCITVKDFPGFATSRLGVCLGMEAIRMVEQGVASPEDIDAAMVLGYRHPVGPLKLTDMVGLDVRMHIGEYLAKELGNAAFEPPALMRQMVADGKLGKKAGAGFYDWD
ncbi:MAG: 3-hydroxyacyl-CoA dehydrogenase family protein [Deltaproteobacteria bacterium]|nr:3-hydroxyacyl-CoA dehydrogenase family protein [Deltaproteobacteria bacterium]